MQAEGEGGGFRLAVGVEEDGVLQHDAQFALDGDLAAGRGQRRQVIVEDELVGVALVDEFQRGGVGVGSADSI